MYRFLFKISKRTITELTRQGATVHIQIDLFAVEHIVVVVVVLAAGWQAVVPPTTRLPRLHGSAGKDEALHEPTAGTTVIRQPGRGVRAIVVTDIAARWCYTSISCEPAGGAVR